MREHEQWIEDYFNGELDDANVPRLRAWLESDELHLRLFVRRSHEHGVLREQIRGLEELRAFNDRPRAPALLSLTAWRSQWQVWSRALSAPPSVSVIVAALFLGLTITAMAFMVPPFYRRITQRTEESTPPAEPRLVAHLSRVQGAQWGSGLSDLRRGSHLVSGKGLDLTAGLAEVRFLSGATLILEGPAQVTLIDDGIAKLEAGKLTGSVEQAPQGLVVQTKLADVTDLGTQFGVDVNVKSGVSVFVMQGSVSVAPVADGTEPIVLRQGEAWSISLDGSRPLDANQLRKQFVWSLRAAGDPPVEEWITRQEELLTRDDVLLYYDFQQDAAAPHRLRNRAQSGAALDGEITDSVWAAGRSPNRGLEFGRRDARVSLTVPDAHAAITLWASVRLDELHGGFQSILMSDGWDQPGKIHWQISKNRVQLALSGAQDHYSSPVVTAGKWWRLATVVDTHRGVVTHYVNGEAAGSSVLVDRVTPEIGSARLGSWLSGARVTERMLQGQIDEFLLFGRALTAGEIRQLDKVLKIPGTQ